MHISFRLCCALNRRTIFLLNREFWSLSSHKLSGDRKAQAFSISDSFFFFNSTVGLNGSGLGLMIFHKMSPRAHHNYL